MATVLLTRSLQRGTITIFNLRASLTPKIRSLALLDLVLGLGLANNCRVPFHFRPKVSQVKLQGQAQNPAQDQCQSRMTSVGGSRPTGTAAKVRELYPEIEPFDKGHLKVSDIHEIYYEQSGQQDGKPVLYLCVQIKTSRPKKEKQSFHISWPSLVVARYREIGYCFVSFQLLCLWFTLLGNYVVYAEFACPEPLQAWRSRWWLSSQWQKMLWSWSLQDHSAGPERCRSVKACCRTKGKHVNSVHPPGRVSVWQSIVMTLLMYILSVRKLLYVFCMFTEDS